MNQSNNQRRPSREADNGYALESIITESILSHPNISPTPRCIVKQEQDQSAILRIDKDLRKKFQKAGLKISEFISNKYLLFPENYKIDRTNDADKSVEDIIIENESRRFAFSIKHNNDSLKHNRPYSLVQSFGKAKGSKEDEDHRKRLLQRCDDFKNTHPGINEFRDVTIEDKEDLYYRLISECKITCERFSKDSNAVRNYFAFIMGGKYIKIRVMTQSDELQILYEDFTNERTLPSLIKDIEIYIGQRTGTNAASWNLAVSLDNGYKFKHRIHSASSEIQKGNSRQIPMKFDVKFHPDTSRDEEII